MYDSEAKATQSRKKKSKKRAKSDLDEPTIVKHTDTAELDAEPDITEPTMAEKLASLDLLSDDKVKNTTEKVAPPTMNIPSADSVHVLLKQALNVQDHALLMDCLYTSDEKVIRKSTAHLHPSDVLKLLKSLLSMIELRGAVIICALPWLRSELSQHASSIASQESSLLLLNSLYQQAILNVSFVVDAGQLICSTLSLLNQGPQHSDLLFSCRHVWIIYFLGLQKQKLMRVLLHLLYMKTMTVKKKKKSMTIQWRVMKKLTDLGL